MFVPDCEEEKMAGGHDNQDEVRAGKARAVALFRYSLIREAADTRLSTKQRGRLVRDLAAREHLGPFDKPVRVSRETIDRWIRGWRIGGFDALVPDPRRVQARTPADVLDMAAGLKREVPARTAAHIAEILRAHRGWAPSERTLQRYFVRLELNTHPDGLAPKAFGRFEADAPNVRWTGDGLHGPTVRGRKAILCAFIDDQSRLLTGYRWARHEDTVRLEGALRAGLASRGIPDSAYMDNGAAMVDKQMARACASLGIRLIHSRPGQPAGRGKIERFFAPCGNSSSSRSVPAVNSTTWPISTAFSLPGSRRSITAGCTPRPDKPHWNASLPARRRPCPPPRSCGKRSCGPSGAPSPRPRR